MQDELKGEKLVLIPNVLDADLKKARERVRERGLSDIASPRELIYMKDIPKLGTGKVDYVRLNDMLREIRENRNP